LARKDAPAVAVMQELAAQYPRYGYRRIQVFLERRGHAMSPDRAYRLWQLHRLQVPRKRPRRRVALHRPRPLPATGVGQVWAYDFVFDACANGQQIKCLTVIDEYTRECLAIDVGGSIRSGRVIEVLAKLVSVHGAPRYLRSDNVLSTEASLFASDKHPVRDVLRHRVMKTPRTACGTRDLPQ
jgi:putative transposase